MASAGAGGEGSRAVLSFKTGLGEIQPSLGRGQLRYFTFELVPALRSCLICGYREFRLVGKANSGPSKEAPAVSDQCQPTRVRSGPAGITGRSSRPWSSNR